MNLDHILLILAFFTISIFSFVFYINSRTKNNRIVGVILMSLVFAIASYCFVPKTTYDLASHQKMAHRFEDVTTIEEFNQKTGKWDMEIATQVYSLAISKTGNYNLMQFFPVLVGYGLLFYMLSDYSAKKKISNKQFAAIVPFVIFGQHILFYFSGLFNYLAICVFSFGAYLEYVKQNKKISWLCYVMAALIHSSLLLPIALVIFLKIKRSNIGKIDYVIAMAAIILVPAIIGLLANMLRVDFIINLKMTLDTYMRNTPYLISLYDGFYLFMSVSKIAIVLWACYLQKNDDGTRLLRNYIYIMSGAVIILSIMSIAMTRLSSLVLFAGIPVIIGSFAEKKTFHALLFRTCVLALSIVFTVYSLHVIAPFIKLY